MHGAASRRMIVDLKGMGNELGGGGCYFLCPHGGALDSEKTGWFPHLTRNVELSAHFFLFYLFLIFIEILSPCEAVEHPAESQTGNIEGWGYVCSD